MGELVDTKNVRNNKGHFLLKMKMADISQLESIVFVGVIVEELYTSPFRTKHKYRKHGSNSRIEYTWCYHISAKLATRLTRNQTKPVATGKHIPGKWLA